MHIFIIVSTILISHLSQQLHTHSSSTYQGYMNSLIERETKLKADLSEIKKESQMLRYRLSLRTGRDPDAQVRLMQETLAEERDILGRIQSYLGLPFNISACQCLNMTDSEKTSAQKLLSSIETKLHQVRQKANNCDQCFDIKELKAQLSREDTFLQSIRDILQSDCCRKESPQPEQKPTGLVDIGKSYFVTNLESAPWIYGNTTQKQLKLTMFALASRHNTTKCKPDQPVALSNKVCGTCPVDLPLWNVGTNKCERCPNQTTYNSSAHVCQREEDEVVEPIIVPKIKKVVTIQNKAAQTENTTDTTKEANKTQVVREKQLKNTTAVDVNKTSQVKQLPEVPVKKEARFNSNPIAINYIGRFPVHHPELPNCTVDKPFATGDSCISCPLPRIFDFNTEECGNCLNNFHFDVNLRGCHQKETGLVSDLYRFKNWITSQPHVVVYNNLAINLTQKNHTKCPNYKPYFDDITCIECSLPRVFDIDHNLCVLPPKGMIFNENMHQLAKEDDLAYNIPPDTPNLIVPTPQFAPKAKNSLCPKQTPYYDGSICVSCQQPFPLFNVKTLKCQRCSKNHIYNPRAQLCQQNHTEYYTDTAAKNLLISNNKSLQWYVNNIENWKSKNPFPTKECPSNRPYKGPNGCIACQGQHQLFNLESGRCESCSQGSIYSAELRKCLKRFYYSNLAVSNILESNNFKSSDYYRIVSQKANNKEVKYVKCPMERPFVIKGVCGNCPPTSPLYNIQKEECTTCQHDDYDEKSKMCIYHPRITSPSAPRLFFQGGPLKDYQQEYNQKIKENSMLRPCPENIPYFNGKKCINCPDESMIFDMIDKKCMHCPSETVYDSSISSCVSPGALKATLERAIMNSV